MSQIQIQLPTGWKLEPLESTFEPAKEKWNPDNSEDLVNYIGLENIESNTGKLVEFYPTSSSLIKSSKNKFSNSDVLYGKLRPYLNKVLLPPFDGICSTDIIVLKPKNNIDKKYLWYFLRSRFVLDRITALTYGTKMPRTKIQDIQSIKIPLPPNTEAQKQIVKKLDYILGQIEEKNKEILKLKDNIVNNYNIQLITIKQRILQTAYTGKLTVNHKQSYSLIKQISELKNNPQLVTYKNNGYFPIPMEWKWLTFDDIIKSMKNGIYKPSIFYGSGVKCLRMYNIEGGKIVLKNVKEMNLSDDEIREYGLEKDDIMLNRVNSRELVAKSAVIPEGLGSLVFESKNIRIRTWKGLIEPHYVNYYLQTKTMRDLIEANCKKTAGMATISQEDIKEWLIPIPSYDEQRDVVHQINKKFELLELLGQKINNLLIKNDMMRKQFSIMINSILSQAFSGKLVS